MAVRRSPYSAQVVLTLSIAGEVLSLSQVGPDFVILRDAPTKESLSGQGRIDVIVDAKVASSNEFFFPHGIVPGSKKIAYF